MAFAPLVSPTSIPVQFLQTAGVVAVHASIPPIASRLPLARIGAYASCNAFFLIPRVGLRSRLLKILKNAAAGRLGD
jgi:hypothetical protein